MTRVPMIVACLVCGQPLDALLAGGLHAGVGVMAGVALVVLAVIGAYAAIQSATAIAAFWIWGRVLDRGRSSVR